MKLFIKRINNFLEKSRSKLNGLLKSKVYEFLFSLTIFVTPVAQLPQLYKAIVAPSVISISVETYVILTYNFSIFVLYGIKHVDWRIFLAMSVGIIEFILIITITMLRGGTFLGWSM